ncbi:uncharacterized protein LOC134532340 [Bacillus rossius redtenbacheri]|uniref:uncharacterized protein LOC134532340 n=1 Tax=Bacillus rossius redtenbacheri TaxID=93214 RepID=UPI002FDDD9FD
MPKNDINQSSIKPNDGGNFMPGDADAANEPILTTEDLGKLLGKPVSQASRRNLTAAGENYGSVMLAVDVVLETGEHEALVAKMFPKNEFARKMFQSPLSMRKEIDMYLSVGPELERIQAEASVPAAQRLRVLCGCPGARLSLEDHQAEDQLADQDSVLLLENLAVQGYRTGDRVAGLDLRHAECALQHLARFHATAVAIRVKKPSVFQTKVLRALKPFKVIARTREDEEQSKRTFLRKLRKIPICEKHIDSLEQLFKKSMEERYSDYFPVPKEPFATILHNDFWTNNMMFKYGEDGKEPTDFKLVDFQTCRYGSPVPDIILFLFTSTQTGIVEEKLDHLLKFYHDCFLKWLEILGCDTKEFSFNRFVAEINEYAPETLDFILFMLRPITLTKEEAKQFTKGPNFDALEFNENYTKRVSNVIDIFVQKGWIH